MKPSSIPPSKSSNRRSRRRRRQRAIYQSAPFPLSPAALVVLIFGYLFWYFGGFMSFLIGVFVVYPGSTFQPDSLNDLRQLVQVLHWLTKGLVLLMLVQVIAEFIRPKHERRLRRSRIACDIFTLLTAALIMVVPYQMDHAITLMPPSDAVHNFEYNFGDNKWHWVPPEVEE